MQPHGIDVGVSGLVGRELGGAAQFVQGSVGSPEAGERQTERVIQTRIARRCRNRLTQPAFALPIPAQTPIEVGEVDRRRRELRAQVQSGFVFGLSLWSATAPR